MLRTRGRPCRGTYSSSRRISRPVVRSMMRMPDSSRRSSVSEPRRSCKPQCGQLRHCEYLHACGEDALRALDAVLGDGTPPRVRRRRIRIQPPRSRGRNTSARAEKTSRPSFIPPVLREHLRACGEDYGSTPTLGLREGTPPRVRRRPDGRGMQRCRPRNTSARAEKT